MHIKERQKKPHKQRRREQLEEKHQRVHLSQRRKKRCFHGREDISLQPREKERGHAGADLHTTAWGRSPTGTDRYSHGGEGGKCEEEEAAEGNFYILTITLRQGVSKWLGESLAVGQG